MIYGCCCPLVQKGHVVDCPGRSRIRRLLRLADRRRRLDLNRCRGRWCDLSPLPDVTCIGDYYEPSADGGLLPVCDEGGGDEFDFVGMSQREKDEILALHNELRGRVLSGEVAGLPRAKDMKKLEWDTDLEKEAERWAMMCPDYSDGTAHPPEDWKSGEYGQNVAWAHASFVESVRAWFAEYEPYARAGVDPLVFRSETDPRRREAGLGQIAHFTAMVNARSDRIGCSQAGGEAYRYRVVHVCNYSPPGNLMVRLSNGTLRPVPAYEAVQPLSTTETALVGQKETEKKTRVKSSPKFRKWGGKRRRVKAPKRTRGSHKVRDRQGNPSEKAVADQDVDDRFRPFSTFGSMAFPTLARWKKERGRRRRSREGPSVNKEQRPRMRGKRRADKGRRKTKEAAYLRSVTSGPATTRRRRQRRRRRKDFITRWFESILGPNLEKLFIRKNDRRDRPRKES